MAVSGAAFGQAPQPQSASPPAQKPKLPFDTFDQTAPRVGELAPDFELGALDGTRVKLSEATQKGPVVLVFGAFS